MGRSHPGPPPDAVTVDAGKATWEYQLTLVTPQVGGGVTPQAQFTAVRHAAVSSQLRAWWRTLHAPQHTTATSLFAAEAELWGSTAHQSRCRVQTTVTKHGSRVTVPKDPDTGDFGQHSEYPGYALFPFNEPREAKLVTGTEFVLQITAAPDRQGEIDAAVHAWVAYGGLGARTRRGCGSLTFTDRALQVPARPDTAGPSGVTTLGRTYLGPAQTDPVAAWRRAVQSYRDFRQRPGFARDPGGRHPGRSRYPEADTLRVRTGAHGHPVVHQVLGFPRADLGLPIVFHFLGHGEPAQHTLEGARPGRQRLASPVITKAVQGEHGYRPMVAVLDAPHVWDGNEVHLSGPSGGPVPRTQLDLAASDRALVAPMGGLPIRDALSTYVLAHGFTEVA